MKNKLALSILSVLVLMLVGVGIYKQITKNQEKEVIKIGVILNLTGEKSISDIDKENTLLIAEREINKTGGIDGKKLKIVTADAMSLSNKVNDAFVSLEIQNIKFYMCGTSFTAMPILQKTEMNKYINASVSGNPKFTEGTNYTIRCFPNVKLGSNLIEKYISMNDFKNIYVLYTNEPYGLSYAENLEKLLLQKQEINFYKESYDYNQKNFKPNMIKVKSKKPDALIIIGYEIHFPLIMKSMIDSRLDIPIIGSEAFYAGNYKEVVNSDLFKKSVFIAPKYLEEMRSDTTGFIGMYKKEHKRDPLIFGVFMADFLKIFQSIAKNNNINNPDSLIKDFKRVHKIKAYSGYISIQSNGDIDYDLNIYKFENDNIKKILFN